MKRQITFFRRAMLCICLIFTAAISYAQSPVRGHIVSREDQKPLIGATVKVKGNNRAVTVTDDDGNFSINVKETDVLVITSVGFANREVKANSDLSSLVMITDQRNLSEVVVTATGIKKESKKLAYSIQTIDAAGLTTAREADPINSLKGNAAGLAININSEIGHSADVIIRGENGSLDRPMFVVDGVPFSSDTYNLNPDDIESFTILKGPSAAALYGFQGKNGAIIISTKKGSRSKKGFSVEFNSSTQFNNGFIALPKYQDDYGAGDNGKYAFGGGGSNPASYFGTGAVGVGYNDYDYDIWGPQFKGQLLPQSDGIYDPSQTF